MQSTMRRRKVKVAPLTRGNAIDWALEKLLLLLLLLLIKEKEVTLVVRPLSLFLFSLFSFLLFFSFLAPICGSCAFKLMIRRFRHFALKPPPLPPSPLHRVVESLLAKQFSRLQLITEEFSRLISEQLNSKQSGCSCCSCCSCCCLGAK